MHQTLIWAVAYVGVTIGSIAMANVVAPSVFPWLPAGIAAGVVLRFGWKYAALGGLGLGIALTMLPGRPSDDILWISTIAASHVLGLTLLPLAMGESGRRISASRIRSVDAARLVLLGIPVVILPTGLVFAAWLPVTGVGQTPLVERCRHRSCWACSPGCPSPPPFSPAAMDASPTTATPNGC